MIASKSNPFDFDNEIDYKSFLHHETLKNVGIFERNKKFKDIQKELSENNCRLELTYPFGYKVG